MATQNLWTFVTGSRASAAVGSTAAVGTQGNLQTNSSEVVRAAVLSGVGIGP